LELRPEAVRESGIGLPDEWLELSELQLHGVLLSPTDRLFALKCGLPRDAAPFLDFSAARTSPLVALSEHYHLRSDALGNDAGRYVVFGGNGNADALCFDNHCNGEIVLIDHESLNGPIRRVFVNSNFRAFAACLIYYRRLCDAQIYVVVDQCECARFPRSAVAGFVKTVDQADPAALIDLGELRDLVAGSSMEIVQQFWTSEVAIIVGSELAA
jgi:SUKH-4 immunity protein